MPMACSICTSPHREDVNRALVEATPKRRIAAQYGLTEAAVRRHEAAGHLPAKLALAAEAAVVAEADDLLGTARRVQREVFDVLERAKASGNLGGVLQARPNPEGRGAAGHAGRVRGYGVGHRSRCVAW